MNKQILIPTDGSKVARKAIKAGIEMAKELGGSVVGYYAADPIERLYVGDDSGVRPGAVKRLQERLAKEGQKHLAEIQRACSAAGVGCETVMSTPATPYQGIIDAARKKKCGMIFMASHGRGKFATLLLGSVTQKVLAHSKIPVLVYR
jgi:nucleotide-binding universal stress UspA family protein